MVEKKRAKKPQEIVPLMLRLREALRGRLAKDAEKGAKSLNAEIVDRLEASYTKDVRIEELKERLEDLRRQSEEAKKVIEAAEEKSAEQGREHTRLIEEFRDKYRAELKELQSRLAHLETASDMVDALLGNEASSTLVRRVVGTLAASPDWSSSTEATKEMELKIGRLVRSAKTFTVTCTVTGTVSAVGNGTVSATSPANGITVADISEHADDETIDSQGGVKNERLNPRT
jgi:hypothetical protein